MLLGDQQCQEKANKSDISLKLKCAWIKKSIIINQVIVILKKIFKLPATLNFLLNL